PDNEDIIIVQEPSSPPSPPRGKTNVQQPISAEAKSSAKVNVGKVAAAKRMPVKRQLCGCPPRPEEKIIVVNQPPPQRPKGKAKRGRGKGNVQQPISAEAKSNAKVVIGKTGKRRVTEQKRQYCGYPTPEPEDNVIIVNQPPPSAPPPQRRPKAKAKTQQPVSAEAKSSAKVNIGKAKGKKRSPQKSDAKSEF
ncbi:81_t:CDS:2, partial [Ambispora leptoticha]